MTCSTNQNSCDRVSMYLGSCSQAHLCMIPGQTYTATRTCGWLNNSSASSTSRSLASKPSLRFLWLGVSIMKGSACTTCMWSHSNFAEQKARICMRTKQETYRRRACWYKGNKYDGIWCTLILASVSSLLASTRLTISRRSSSGSTRIPSGIIDASFSACTKTVCKIATLTQ